MALDDGRVVSNFVAQALTGTPLTIYGDGQQTRSFQYVSDLIEGEPEMMVTQCAARDSDVHWLFCIDSETHNILRSCRNTVLIAAIHAFEAGILVAS